jgi:multiple sugar transport system substrate-binding protein
MLNPQAHAIFTHTPDKQAAKDFLRWLMKPQQLGPWYDIAATYYQPFLHAYDDAAMWKVEPRNIPYRDALKTAHLPGWPAPLSRAQSETIAKYVVIDMFAKACAGKSTKDAIAEAKAQLIQIHKTA